MMLIDILSWQHFLDPNKASLVIDTDEDEYAKQVEELLKDPEDPNDWEDVPPAEPEAP